MNRLGPSQTALGLHSPTPETGCSFVILLFSHSSLSNFSGDSNSNSGSIKLAAARRHQFTNARPNPSPSEADRQTRIAADACPHRGEQPGWHGGRLVSGAV